MPRLIEFEGFLAYHACNAESRGHGGEAQRKPIPKGLISDWIAKVWDGAEMKKAVPRKQGEDQSIWDRRRIFLTLNPLVDPPLDPASQFRSRLNLHQESMLTTGRV